MKKNGKLFSLFSQSRSLSTHRIASLPIRTSLRVFSSAMARATAALFPAAAAAFAAAVVVAASAAAVAASAAASLHPHKAAPAPAHSAVFAAHSPSCGGRGGIGSPGETRAVAARHAAERRAEGVERGGGGEEEEEVDGSDGVEDDASA